MGKRKGQQPAPGSQAKQRQTQLTQHYLFTKRTQPKAATTDQHQQQPQGSSISNSRPQHAATEQQQQQQIVAPPPPPPPPPSRTVNCPATAATAPRHASSSAAAPASAASTAAAGTNTSAGATTSNVVLQDLQPQFKTTLPAATAAAPAEADGTMQQPARPAKAQQPWWKNTSADPVVAHVRFSGGTSKATLPVKLSCLQQLGPFELIHNFLPAPLDRQLLSVLLQESGSWERGTWWFAGKQQLAPRSSVHYQLQQQQTAAHCQQQEQQECSATCSTSTVAQAQASGSAPAAAAAAAAARPQTHAQEAGIGSAPPAAAVSTPSAVTDSSSMASPLPAAAAAALATPQVPACKELEQAAALVAQAVSQRLADPRHAWWQLQLQQLNSHLAAKQVAAAGLGQAAAATAAAANTIGESGEKMPELPLAAAAAAAGPSSSQAFRVWAPSYALANLYADGQQSVGSHTDRLTAIGPLPTIASVSLGAGRVFRLHPANDAVAAKAGAAAAAACGAAAGGFGRVVSSIDVSLPHNSLLIMWPPTQEEWMHEVPKTSKALAPHPISGPCRINLTFRQLSPARAAAVPNCRCGRRAIMKCKPHQQQRIVYYYSCDNTQGRPCGFYKQAAEIAEAGGGL